MRLALFPCLASASVETYLKSMANVFNTPSEMWDDPTCSLFVVEGGLDVGGSLKVDGQVWVVTSENATAALDDPSPHVQARCLIPGGQVIPNTVVIRQAGLFVSGPLYVGGSLVVSGLNIGRASKVFVGIRGDVILDTCPHLTPQGEVGEYLLSPKPEVLDKPTTNGEDPIGDAIILDKLVVQDAAMLDVWGNIHFARSLVQTAGVVSLHCGNLYGFVVEHDKNSGSLVILSGGAVNVRGVGRSSMETLVLQGGGDLIIEDSIIANRDIQVDDASFLGINGDLHSAFLVADDASTVRINGSTTVTGLLEGIDGSRLSFRKATVGILQAFDGSYMSFDALDVMGYLTSSRSTIDVEGGTNTFVNASVSMELGSILRIRKGDLSVNGRMRLDSNSSVLVEKNVVVVGSMATIGRSGLIGDTLSVINLGIGLPPSKVDLAKDSMAATLSMALEALTCEGCRTPHDGSAVLLGASSVLEVGDLVVRNSSLAIVDQSVLNTTRTAVIEGGVLLDLRSAWTKPSRASLENKLIVKRESKASFGSLECEMMIADLRSTIEVPSLSVESGVSVSTHSSLKGVDFNIRGPLNLGIRSKVASEVIQVDGVLVSSGSVLSVDSLMSDGDVVVQDGGTIKSSNLHSSGGQIIAENGSHIRSTSLQGDVIRRTEESSILSQSSTPVLKYVQDVHPGSYLSGVRSRVSSNAIDVGLVA